MYNEEVVAMLFAYVKMLAEKQAEGSVRDCVITIPSWFTYDQRLMIKDSAELANLKVLQLVHENTAAATMFAIDQKIEPEQPMNVLFYNMGGMDTEVSIVRFSMFNVTEKKSSPYVEILSEAYDKELGGKDLDIVITNILADKFNAMKEREGKPDVRENVRAIKRLLKDSQKIKEILSANKAASVKVPELQDYVTLQFNLPREDFEAAGASFFERVTKPIDEALEKAGLTLDDIDQVELLGGGIRVPKVAEILEEALKKDLSVHLNGDEAMCFGSAFMASNSSSLFKVKQVFLTQHPAYDVHMKISPINAEDGLTEEEQTAEGIEEADIIKYTQDLKLFNQTDYIGKSKGLSINYDKDMKLELFKADQEGELELLDTFLLDNLKDQLAAEIDSLKREQEREKKKAAKDKADKEKAEKEKKEKADGDSEESEEDTKEEPPKVAEPEEETADEPIARPKIKISVEFSRSGYMQISKAAVGSHTLNVEHVRKDCQLDTDQLRAARSKLKWYENRDQTKIKTDVARNDYESGIYRVREWLREDENFPYVKEEIREAQIERLTEQEDWLYEDGADANHTTYNALAKNLSEEFRTYVSRKEEHELRETVVATAEKGLEAYEGKVEELKTAKPWVTEEERQDVTDKIAEIKAWLQEQIEAQSKLELSEDPVFKSEEAVKKLK